MTADGAAATEESRILDFVSGHLSRTGPVTDTALDLVASRTVDSMAMLELVVWMEATWGLRVGNDDLTPENFRSVDAIARFVRRKRPTGGGAA